MINPYKNILKCFCIHLSIVVLVSSVFRLYFLAHVDMASVSLLKSFLIAIFFDFVVAVYTFWPLLLMVLVCPIKFGNSIAYKKAVTLGLFFSLSLFLFLPASEYFFYEAFKDRFNFIAVDYLVYTNEVLQNIWESYPITKILIGLFVLSISFTVLIYKKFIKGINFTLNFQSKFFILIAYIGVFAINVFFVSESKILEYTNTNESLLSKNGLHALFAAYRNNEINYDQYYTRLSPESASIIVHNEMKSKDVNTNIGSSKNSDEDEESIVTNIVSTSPSKKYNVILVLMESLSAKFMGLYGSHEGLTPNLDNLAQNGIYFDNMFSTGTRTVRGIEAVMLSIPPTPGQSIVRRLESEGLFNIGTVFKNNKYENKFIYGGRSFFDNMGQFFRENGFSVIDQNDFQKDEVHFANAWGVSDEDLLDKVIKETDISFKQNKNTFQFVLTTSNHRPYTYPENKIDIPSGSGRSGAVKYADFAIGEFIKKAKKKPWFNSTVFVFVSDHNASVAGADNIQPEDYRIPFILYAPKLIKPKKISALASQIDVAPTVLGLLGFSYQSRFFGLNLFENTPNRAFLGTYQKVGYMTPSQLTILEPNHKIKQITLEQYQTTSATLKNIEVLNQDKNDLSDNLYVTVAYYKTASNWYKNKLLKESLKFPENLNIRYSQSSLKD